MGQTGTASRPSFGVPFLRSTSMLRRRHDRSSRNWFASGTLDFGACSISAVNDSCRPSGMQLDHDCILCPSDLVTERWQIHGLASGVGNVTCALWHSETAGVIAEFGTVQAHIVHSSRAAGDPYRRSGRDCARSRCGSSSRPLSCAVVLAHCRNERGGMHEIQ